MFKKSIAKDGKQNMDENNSIKKINSECMMRSYSVKQYSIKE